MSQQQPDDKPKGIIKSETQSKEKQQEARKSISFKRVATVVTFPHGDRYIHSKCSITHQYEMTEQPIQEMSNSAIVPFSEGNQEKEGEIDLLAEDSRLFENAAANEQRQAQVGVLQQPQSSPSIVQRMFSSVTTVTAVPQNIGTENVAQPQTANLEMPQQQATYRSLTPDKSDLFRERLSQITKKTLKAEVEEPLPKP